MIMDVSRQIPPEALLTAIERWRGRYTLPRALYEFMWLDLNFSVGVFGDRDGTYEWFVWKAGELQTSNLGYGNPAGALRDVLAAEWLGQTSDPVGLRANILEAIRRAETDAGITTSAQAAIVTPLYRALDLLSHQPEIAAPKQA